MDQNPAKSADSALSRESAVSGPRDIDSSYPEGRQSPEGKIYPTSCGVKRDAEAQSSHPVAVAAEPLERPSEAHTRRPIIKTHPVTGMKYWDMPTRRPMHEIHPKHDTAGLRAFAMGSGTSMALEYVSKDPIDESDAIDAQCRAGWDDNAYGFWGFKTAKLEDGSFVAVWKCSNSNPD